ncbi:MAG: hypothetical protein OXL36_22555 [Bryobacterales bacterium]|nr:hypothetical protein [Bryobacterales bacterium]
MQIKVHWLSDITIWSEPGPSPRVFTKHESRNTSHGFFSKHGFFPVVSDAG